MRGVRRALAGVVSVAAVAGLGALSRVPYHAEDGAAAVLRLSWRVRGVRVEACRKPTQEELEALPVHMRRPEICEGGLVPYRLAVSVDGVPVESSVVTAAGAKHDRPLYVFRELRLAPGEHDVAVTFERTVESAAEEGGEVPPASMSVERRVELGAGEVTLITYDPELRTLVLRGP